MKLKEASGYQVTFSVEEALVPNSGHYNGPCNLAYKMIIKKKLRLKMKAT